MKHKTFRPLTNTRRMAPKVRKTEHGIQLMCPFCVPTHAIVPGQVSSCGTVVEVNAVQTLIPQRTVRDKNLTCLKCHESGKGIMVPYMGGYVHLEDCKPGTMLMPELPEFSPLAKRVFNMREGFLKHWFEKRYGRAEPVKEIDPQGNKTGNVLGYVFMKV